MVKSLIRFDWAMKRLLRNKANFDILEGFLSVLLKEDIVIEQILESESNQEDVSLKFNRVDILALNSKKELIIIELQNDSERDYFHRMLYASSKALVEHFEISNPYINVKKVYSVNIVYFNLGQGEDYVYHGTTEFKGLHAGDTLRLSTTQKTGFGIDSVYKIYPEYYIIKVDNFNNLAKDSLDEWIYYLKNDEIKEGFKAKGLDSVKKKLEFNDLSPQEKAGYLKAIENKVIDKDVFETGMSGAKEEGRKEEKKQGIVNALKRGKLTIEEIAEDFDVTVEFVLLIKEEMASLE